MPKAEQQRAHVTYGVDVVLLTWNSRTFLPRIVDTLAAQQHVDLRLHVVDNGSSDGSADWIAAHANPTTLIRNPRNRGFAEACNQGIAAGTQPFVQLLNHDVTLAPDYCLRLCEALSARPNRGSATGKVLQEGSFPPTIDSTGHIVWRSGHAFNRGEGLLDEGQFDSDTEVFGVSAAAAMYKREAMSDAAVDGEVFPSAFFAYVEDVDLDFRLRWRGWSAVYVPAAVGHHARSAGGAKRMDWISDIVRKNHMLLLTREFDSAWFRKHSGETVAYVLKDTYHLFKHPRRLVYLGMVAQRLAHTLRARREIHSRRLATPQDVHRWLKPTDWSWTPQRWRDRPSKLPQGDGVSVVILSQDQGALLGDAVRSALEQTIAPRDVIVVDDGSEDDTAQVADGFRGRIRYIHTTRGGPHAAKNVGLTSSRGEYIVFLEASHRLHPQFVERTLRFFRIESDPRLAGVYTQVMGAAAFPEFDALRLAKLEYHSAIAVFRWTAIRAYPFTSAASDGLEDWVAWATLYANGYRFGLLDEPLVNRLDPVRADAARGTAAGTWRTVARMAWTSPRLFMRHPSALLSLVDEAKRRPQYRVASHRDQDGVNGHGQPAVADLAVTHGA